MLEQGDDQVLIDNARIMLENGRLAFSDMRRLFDANGNLKPTHEWADDMAAVVQSIETRELFGEGAGGKRQIGFVHKIKLWDKSAALERLMRHLGNNSKHGHMSGKRKAWLRLLDRDEIAQLRQRALSS